MSSPLDVALLLSSERTDAFCLGAPGALIMIAPNAISPHVQLSFANTPFANDMSKTVPLP
jgi:hypothetical protein